LKRPTLLLAIEGGAAPATIQHKAIFQKINQYAKKNGPHGKWLRARDFLEEFISAHAPGWNWREDARWGMARATKFYVRPSHLPTGRPCPSRQQSDNVEERKHWKPLAKSLRLKAVINRRAPKGRQFFNRLAVSLENPVRYRDIKRPLAEAHRLSSARSIV
jgi:hypothetical protein